MQLAAASDSKQVRADSRLQRDLESLGRLDPDRASVADRLEEALGPELAAKLVFALAGSGALRLAQTAAA